MNFSERLIKLRKTHGLTQEELAERMGVTRQSVSKWETGESIPDLAKSMQLAQILGVSLDVLSGNMALDEDEVNDLTDGIITDDIEKTISKKYNIIAFAAVGAIWLSCLFALLLKPAFPFSNTFSAGLNHLLFSGIIPDIIFPVVCTVLAIFVLLKKNSLHRNSLLIVVSILFYAVLYYMNDSQPFNVRNIIILYVGDLLFNVSMIRFAAMLVYGVIIRKPVIWIISIIGIALPLITSIIVSSTQNTQPAFMLAYISTGTLWFLLLLLIAYDWVISKKGLAGKGEI